MTDGNNSKPGQLEERIRALCSEVLVTDDEQRLREVCAELREAISEHIEALRASTLELKLRELSSAKRLNDLSAPKE